ncbi:MAG: 2,4-dihydroxyhept-2-ene-1,7-dioic acid aldolase [Campylobacteraceae bacterium]|nr:2,4-dihydroxyhept-2-ene-1,7-dioic acid aldolase [Campylobacteraceae bacterium]
MKNHKLIQKWTNGQTSLNAWLSIPEAFSAEIMAHTGFDSITIDMQHGVNDYLKTVDMLRAINTTDTVTMVRVPWLDPAHIMKILDAGVNGIICPMINNKKEAQKLVEYSYYPPFGKRSFGPIRAKYVYEGNYAKVANESLLIIAMIETKEALDNLDEILSVDGIDAVYIGPADLSFNLGYEPKFDQEEPYVLEKIKYILKTVKKHNKFAGIHNASVEYALRMKNLGFDFVTVGSDANFIIKAASEVVSSFKNRKKEESSSY